MLVVFPAHAGMNRDKRITTRESGRVPRPRGDEPAELEVREAEEVVFPAHAGMNQHHHDSRNTVARVPRPRGDEPTGPDGREYPDLCSPPTRG